VDDFLVAIGSSLLSSFAFPNELEIVELSAQRGKGRMVKVLGKDILFDLDSIVDDDFAERDDLSFLDGSWSKGNDILVLQQHVDQTSEESRVARGGGVNDERHIVRCTHDN
jgi:hypothetical protein